MIWGFRDNERADWNAITVSSADAVYFSHAEGKDTMDASVDRLKEETDSSFANELVCRFEEEIGSYRIDSVIEEVVFTVLVNGEPYRDMACSPWRVRELVVGGLFTAGLIESADEIASLDIDEAGGVAAVALAATSRSSDGSAIDRVLRPVPSTKESPLAPMLTAREVSERIEFLEGGSRLFHRTGGVHSAVMVDAAGELVAWFEDIGRHNALDKLVGWCVLNKVDASDKVLLFSGRVPREIIARTVRAGFPIVISPGAPTNLSIRLACDHGVTLIGFAKDGKFNVYTHEARIQ